MKVIQIAKVAAVAGFALVAGSMALQAKTVNNNKPAPPTPVTCKFGTQSQFTAFADVWTSTACVNQIGGNDSDKTGGNGVTNVNTAGTNGGGLFGYSNWVQDSKYDANGSYGPSGLLGISNLNGLISGTWSVSSWSGIGAAMLVLKGGNGFVSYLLDLTAGTTGQWSVQALTNGGGNVPNISHISLYTVAGNPPPPAPVPVPAAGLLLIGALGGLAAMRGKKRKA